VAAGIKTIHVINKQHPHDLLRQELFNYIMINSTFNIILDESYTEYNTIVHQFVKATICNL